MWLKTRMKCATSDSFLAGSFRRLTCMRWEPTFSSKSKEVGHKKRERFPTGAVPGDDRGFASGRGLWRAQPGVGERPQSEAAANHRAATQATAGRSAAAQAAAGHSIPSHSQPWLGPQAGPGGAGRPSSRRSVQPESAPNASGFVRPSRTHRRRLHSPAERADGTAVPAVECRGGPGRSRQDEGRQASRNDAEDERRGQAHRSAYHADEQDDVQPGRQPEGRQAIVDSDGRQFRSQIVHAANKGFAPTRGLVSARGGFSLGGYVPDKPPQ